MAHSDGTFRDKLALTRSKRLLAIDGGGILGVLAVEFLARIEAELRRRLGRGDDFVLADYFDYIAGTSTGAMIAAGLALGLPVWRIREFYHKHSRAIFRREWLPRRFLHSYRRQGLADLLKQEIGETTTLGSEKLRTLLMIVLRNATTDSTWPLSNNPEAIFNVRPFPGAPSNLDLPLWQLVRASAAAPTFFPPEVVQVAGRSFVFVDGGVTALNNPAFQLFSMATAAPYRLNWQAGEDRMLLISIGTGYVELANERLRPEHFNLIYNAKNVPLALISAASAQQDFLCRMFGTCRHGHPIELEVGDMIGDSGRGPIGPHGSVNLFTYLRYNVDLSQRGLSAMGLPSLRASVVRKIDSTANIAHLARIGEVASARDFNAAHLDGFDPERETRR